MTPVVELWQPRTPEGKRVVLFTITPIPGRESEAAEKLERYVTHWVSVEPDLGPYNIFIEKDNPFLQLVVEGI